MSAAERDAWRFPGWACTARASLRWKRSRKSYRYELASQGIDSVVIEPGAYATSAVDKLEREEDPGRKSGYGEMALVPGKIVSQLISSRANPQEIADFVLQVIETPGGQRALRYRVGPGGPGGQKINAVTDEVQVQVLEAFGVTALAKFKKPSSAGK